MTSNGSRRSANPLPRAYPTHDVGVQTRREHVTCMTLWGWLPESVEPYTHGAEKEFDYT